PACVPLGNIPDTEIYKRVGVFKQAAETPGVKVVRCPAPLYFGNIEYFREKLMAILEFDPARVARKRDKALKKLKKRLSREAALPINAGAQNEAFSASDQSETSDESGDDAAVGAGVEEVKATREARGAHEVVATVETKWAPPTKRELAAGTLGPDGEGGGAGPWRQAWLAVELEGVPRVTVDTVILDFSSVTYLDTVAVNTLTTVFTMVLGHDAVLSRLERAGFFAGAVARSSFFPTTRDAALWHAAHAAPPVPLSPRASPRASVSPLCEFGLTAATFSGSVSTVTSRPKRQRSDHIRARSPATFTTPSASAPTAPHSARSFLILQRQQLLTDASPVRVNKPRGRKPSPRFHATL
ncbi:unnamed protein product, partial [Lampetra planeri]